MINSSMKMFDAVCNNSMLLLVLERFGIRLGFGEMSVREVCEKYNISDNLFVVISNLYCCMNTFTNGPYSVDENDAGKIVEYLKASHDYFLDEKIPKLKILIKKSRILKNQDEYYMMIEEFINKYFSEVQVHMGYENDVVFPYIESLLKRAGVEHKYSISSFRKNHTNIEDKVTDLKNLLIKHLPSDYCSPDRRRILFELYDLEFDITIHNNIENNILIPLVEKIEKKQNAQ